MTPKMKKYSVLIIAAVMLIAMAFAGAASATDITTGQELANNIVGSTYDSGTNTVSLNQDAQLTDELVIKCSVTLDLKGKKLTAPSHKRLFEVKDSATFTLNDSVGGGELVGDQWSVIGMGVYVNSGTFNMNGGNITKCKSSINCGGVYVNTSCTFNMYGGNITGCSMTGVSGYGGGVYIYKGTFNMYGGNIIGCTANASVSSKYGGGGVYVDEGAFNMYGGNITGCHAESADEKVYGGGVSVNGGTFTMTNGNITECNAGSGGGVYLNSSDSSSASFTMSGGNIIDCMATRSVVDLGGGGVHVASGTFTMNDGTITGCKANQEDGGGVFVEGGQFTMNCGKIIDCTAYSDGGGVFIKKDAAFTMTGGNITECNAQNEGGGVCASGDFTMTNGNIFRCSATKNGGGVDNSAGSFTMTNGNITECSANSGGGVYVGKEFTMDGGNIIGCTASGTDIGTGGGGVCAGGDFTMTNGKISGCAATTGSGVYVLPEGGTFTMNKTALVDTSNDVYLEGYDDGSGPYLTKITLGDGGFKPGSYGAKNISLGTNPLMEISGWLDHTIVSGGASNASCFVLSPALQSAGYVLKAGGTSGKDLNFTSKPSTYVEVNSWAGLNKSIAEWTDTDEARVVAVNASILNRVAGNNTDGINVYGKIILTTNESPVTGTEAVINGNGYGRLFNVSSGGNLTICGNGTSTTINLTGGHMYLDHGAGIFVDSYGNLTINDGVMITNCTADYLNEGGGVYVNENARFLMNGGEISDCEACYGGGVENYGTFEMSGGSIKDNVASDYGAGVENHRGIFNIGGNADIDANNNVVLFISGDNVYNINADSTFEGNVGNISLYKSGADNVTAWAGKVVVKNGASVKGKFALSTASAYSGYQLSASGADLIFSKKSTPTPSYSSSSKHSGYTQILSQGQVAPTPYATTTPTVAPTAKPTTVVNPTAKPTSQATTQPTQSSPAPIAGLIAGLGAAALVLARLRR